MAVPSGSVTLLFSAESSQGILPVCNPGVNRSSVADPTGSENDAPTLETAQS
jgi:hypothetical protein